MTPLPSNFKAKLGAWDPDVGWRPVEHQNEYVSESISGVNRLLVASQNPVELLRQLLPAYGTLFRVAYLLVSPPAGYEPARFECEMDINGIESLLSEFWEFLNTDARHHLWFRSLESKGGTVIWDEHNWLYFYGQLKHVRESLISWEYAEQRPAIPFPHLHNESAENNPLMDHLLARFDWVQVPVSNLQ